MQDFASEGTAEKRDVLSRSYRLVERIPLRVQLGVVALGYAAVAAVAAVLLVGRYLAALRDPVSASGGMWATGDLFLAVFLNGLVLFPTILLAWVIARFEAAFTAYSWILVGVSITGPVCLVVLALVGNNADQTLGWVCFYRLLSAPFVLLAMGFSRWMARFDRAKRLTTYALAIEALTFAAAIAVFVTS